MSEKQEIPIVLAWILSILLGIVFGCFLMVGGIFIACDWNDVCRRLSIVGLIAFFTGVILMLSIGSSMEEEDEDEPKTGTIVPEKSTPEA